MLKVKNLTKQVSIGEESLIILRDVGFELGSGASLAILGESGSGKTTLLGLLAGLDEPSNGQVFLNGQAIFDLSEDKRAALRMKHLGFVFQNFQLIEGLSAIENVMMPLELQNRKDARQKAEEILAQVGLAHRLHHYPNQLSGGEQQRVAVARAFVTGPDLLLADEPTGNLDTKTGQQIIDLMFDLNRRQKTTLILVTHDVHLAALCDFSLTLSGGDLLSFESNQSNSKKQTEKSRQLECPA